MKKLSLLPLLLITGIGAVWASTIIFPNTTEFARVPQGAGTIGGALYGLFNPVDGSAKNTQKLAGKYASGYLQDRDCSGEPINKVWAGVDSTGRGICGHITTPLASIGKFTSVVGGVLVKKGGNGPGTPANLTDDLKPGDIIVTVGGTGTITFTDDLSILRLDTNTTVALSTGENTSGQSVAQAILSDGRLWGRILTSTGVNLGGGGMVAGVRGTSVSVEESAGQYTLAIIDSRIPSEAATVNNVLISDTVPTLPTPAGQQFIYASGSPNAPISTAVSKADLLTTSAWIRENMRYDIIYLTGSTEPLRTEEHLAAEPSNNEKNRLCLNYDGTHDGKWMTDFYGCQSMDTLAIADYTRTGSLTMAYNGYTSHQSDNRTCPTAPGQPACWDTLVLDCDINTHLVGYHGSCQNPSPGVVPNYAGYPLLGGVKQIREGWSYDCDGRTLGGSIYSTENGLNDQQKGGASLTIYCAYNSMSSIPFPLAMTAGSMQPDAALGGVNITAANARIEYTFINSLDLALLVGKTLKIELASPLNLPLTSPYTKRYLFDGGSTIKYWAVNGKCFTETNIGPKICRSINGSTSPYLDYNGSDTSISLPITTPPLQFILGASFLGTTYNNPITATIKKISIQ